jgi:hypothetical protein
MKNINLGSTLDSFLDELKQNKIKLALNKIIDIISDANLDYSLVEYKNLLNLRWGGNGLFIKILEKKSNTPFFAIIEFCEEDIKLNEKNVIKMFNGEDFQLNKEIVLDIIKKYVEEDNYINIEFYKYKKNKIVQIEDMAGKVDLISMDLNDPIEFIFDHFDSSEAIVPRMRIVEISPEEFYQLKSE